MHPDDDHAFLAGRGSPTLQYGPGDVRLAHGPLEQVRVSEVVTVPQALVLATLRAVGCS